MLHNIVQNVHFYIVLGNSVILSSSYCNFFNKDIGVLTSRVKPSEQFVNNLHVVTNKL